MPSMDLNKLSQDVVEYLEDISNPEKVELSKRWNKDKDYVTYGLRLESLRNRLKSMIRFFNHATRVSESWRC